MLLLTRQQRIALKAVFDRQPLYVKPDGTMSGWAHWPRATYRQFRRTALPLVQTSSIAPVVMVPWCNMWLGIEPDGYTHS